MPVRTTGFGPADPGSNEVRTGHERSDLTGENTPNFRAGSFFIKIGDINAKQKYSY